MTDIPMPTNKDPRPKGPHAQGGSMSTDTATARMVGHATLSDGTHIRLTHEECQALLDAAKAARVRRAASMPTDRDALNALHDAYQRLTELGWREAIYCPKDGSMFDVIEAGSTGVHRASYHGKWPTGGWDVYADGDVWPSHPILFRLDPEAQAAETARLAEAAERYAAETAAERDPGAP